MKGGEWLPQRARGGKEGGLVWSAAARRRFGSNSRKRPLRKTRKSRKGRVGRQGSNSRDSQLRIERITRMGKGGVRDRTAGAANYERYESHERGRGAAGGGAIQRRSGPEKTAGLLPCSSANRLFSLRNHLCTLCVLCGERAALLGPVVGGIDAGVVQRAVDRDPIRAIDSPVVPAGWADGESRCHLDPALLAFGDGPDFLGHFG